LANTTLRDNGRDTREKKRRGKDTKIVGMKNIPYDHKIRPHNELHDRAHMGSGKGNYRVLLQAGTDRSVSNPEAEACLPKGGLESRKPTPPARHQESFSERYRELYDSAPMACLSLDERGRIMEANRSAASLFGMRQEHLINLPLVNFLDWGDRPVFTDFLKSITLQTTQHIEMRLLFGSNPNTWVHIEGTLQPHPHDESAELRLALIDITERKSEEQRMTEEARTQGTANFATNIAHVLNNRMATVLGYADLLKQDINLDANGQRMAANISQAAQMVGDLTDLIVAYACPGQAGAAEADMNAAIASVLQAEQDNPRIHTVQDLQSDLWKIKIDPRQLHMIVANLFTNASEAIVNQGRIKITTRNLKRKAADPAYLQELGSGYYVRLTVQDTGCGIQPEDLSRIFEPFYSTKFMGRGMGLAAVQGVVKGCRGHIEVTSAPYCTCFSIYLPAVRTSEK